MKTMTAIKPQKLASIPCSTFCAPREGPIVRSSTICTGAINAPDFNNIERFCASAELLTPVIWKLELKRP